MNSRKWMGSRGTALFMAAVMTILWTCPFQSASAQVEQKRKYDLSARQTDELLKLDAKLWADINRFVFLTAFDLYPPQRIYPRIYQDRSKYGDFIALQHASFRWGGHTFRDLELFAQELSNGSIRKLLTDLKSAVERRPKDPAGAQQAFAASAGPLISKLENLEEHTKNVKRDLEELTTCTLRASILAQSVNDFPERALLADMGPRMRDVVPSLATVQDRWGALSSDVANLKKEMDAHLAVSNNDFDLLLTIDFGLESWEAVERTAAAFVANAREQRKYLTGENFYDASPVKEGEVYVMEHYSYTWFVTDFSTNVTAIFKPAEPPSFFLDAKYSGLSRSSKVLTRYDHTVPPRSIRQRLKRSINGFEEWRFERVGRGWWRIYSGGDFLEVVASTAEGQRSDSLLPATIFVPIMIDGRYRTNLYFNTEFPVVFKHWAQCWRFLPTEKPGYFILYNAWLGESYPLFIVKRPGEALPQTPLVLMGTPLDGDSRNTYWSFQAVFP